MRSSNVMRQMRIDVSHSSASESKARFALLTARSVMMTSLTTALILCVSSASASASLDSLSNSLDSRPSQRMIVTRQQQRRRKTTKKAQMMMGPMSFSTRVPIFQEVSPTYSVEFYLPRKKAHFLCRLYFTHGKMLWLLGREECWWGQLPCFSLQVALRMQNFIGIGIARRLPYGANSLIMLDGAAMSCFVCHYHMKSLSRGVLATKPTLNHLLRFVSLILGFFCTDFDKTNVLGLDRIGFDRSAIHCSYT